MSKTNTRRARGRKWVREAYGWRLRHTGWCVCPAGRSMGTWFVGYFTYKVQRDMRAVVDGRGVTHAFVTLKYAPTRTAAMRIAAALERQMRSKEGQIWLAA